MNYNENRININEIFNNGNLMWQIHYGSNPNNIQNKIQRIYLGSQCIWPVDVPEVIENSITTYSVQGNSQYNIKDSQVGGLYEVDPTGYTYISFKFNSSDSCHWRNLSTYFKTTNIVFTNINLLSYSNYSTNTSDNYKLATIGNTIFSNPYTNDNNVKKYVYCYWGDGKQEDDISKYTNKEYFCYIVPKEYAPYKSEYNSNIIGYISPNNTGAIRYSYIWMYKYINLVNEYIEFDNWVKTPIAILYQKANIITKNYIHVAFATDINTSSIITSSTTTSINLGNDETSKVIALFVEIGTSTDEGKTIHWNEAPSSSNDNKDSRISSIATEFKKQLKITSTNPKISATIVSFVNNNYFTIQISTTKNTVENSLSVSETLTLSNSKNIKGHTTSKASYINNSESTSQSSSYYNVEVNPRSTTLIVSCTYPNYEF